MAVGFMAAASKKNSDIKGFLRDASSGNGIKYVAEKSAKHLLYIPFLESEEVGPNGETYQNKSLCSIAGKAHEWNGTDGKYKSTVCLDGVVLKDAQGNITNDGTCPFCARLSDAWEIYKYRMDREQQTCGKTGEELKKHLDDLKSDFAEERKAKEARDYIYILVAKFRTDKVNNVIIGQRGLPEFDLKVMKLSTSRSEKIMKSVENSGLEFLGCEIIFDYPDTEDTRHLSSDCVTAPVYPNSKNSILAAYPALQAEIQAAAAAFSWEGIDKSFQEWKGMTNEEAKITTDSLFKQYDSYKNELAVNPNAKYMEYVGPKSANTESATPSAGTGNLPAGAGVVDVNSVFGSESGPSIANI